MLNAYPSKVTFYTYTLLCFGWIEYLLILQIRDNLNIKILLTGLCLKSKKSIASVQQWQPFYRKCGLSHFDFKVSIKFLIRKT